METGISLHGALPVSNSSPFIQCHDPESLYMIIFIQLHCDSWAVNKPTWTPESIMMDFENEGFLQMMEDLIQDLEFQSK